MLTLGFGFIPRMRADDCVELAQRGEELGFDTCWLADQTFYYDPFSLLGTIAAKTNRIGLGVGVTNPFSRHPTQLARAAHALAHTSNNRFSLGIGAGNRKELLAKLDIPQRQSAKRTGAAVRIIRDLLQGQRVNNDNPYFPITNVVLESPAPADVPLLVAARGPLMLAMAGEMGDGAIVECLLTPDAVAWAKEKMGQGATKDGFQYVSWGVGLLVDSYDDVPTDVRNMVGHLIAIMPDELLAVLDLDREKMARLRADYAEGGPAAVGKYIGAQELAAVTFVGPADALRTKLSDLDRCGVDHVAFLLMGKTGEENKRTLHAFAQHVLTLY